MNDTKTPITTTARRIAREANDGWAAGYRLYFDSEGSLVEFIHGQTAEGPKSHAHAVTVTGGHVTQRQIQDQIDARREQEEALQWAADNPELMAAWDRHEDGE